MARDFVDEIVAARTARNPGFPRLVEEAEFRRKAARQLAAQREKLELSQTVVAAMMGTSASVVSKLESGADVKISTLPVLLGHVPFEGKLRTSRMADGELLLVNEGGRLFRHQLPSRLDDDER
jgi:hypothetical protein